MSKQEIALIRLQKRMLDADTPRRITAVAIGTVISAFYVEFGPLILYFCLYCLSDIAMLVALSRFAAAPRSRLRLRLVQGAAFATMSCFLSLAVMLWLAPGLPPKIGAVFYIMGGMLSVMLVRSAYLPITIANSLPLAGAVAMMGFLGHESFRPIDLLFLGFGFLVMSGYFVMTLLFAQRLNQELAQARDIALERVATQKRFLATMSHELRTPLNGILGVAQSLAAERPGLGAEVIRDAARDMKAMVDDLLDNAAIEAGALRIRPEPTRISDMLAQIDLRWRGAFEAKGLTLDLTQDTGLPERMMIDPLRLSQCLSNLLANALRLTEKGGATLALARHGDGLEATLQDTGPGLAEGIETRLFEPFETFDMLGQGTGSGTGLGLSITRGLAREMGGDLVFERPEAGGSRFRLHIRASDVTAPPAQPDLERSRTATSLASTRVMVVDDIATNRLVLRLLLAAPGVEVIEAAAGSEVLDRLADPAAPQPDVILMDIRMPELSGFETLARLREKGYRGPVIAVSADVAPQDRADALAHGFDGYLTKPVESSDLQALLGKSLKRQASL